MNHFKSVHQTKGGGYYDVEVFAQFFSNNGKNIICSIINEIGESSFYRNLLNHTERMIHIGGWKLNLQDESLVVTDYVMCIFDTKDKKDLLPKNVVRFFVESKKLEKLMNEVIHKGAAYDKVFTLKLSNGTRKYIRCLADPIVKGIKVYKVIGAYQDVTEETLKAKELTTFKYISVR